LVEKFFLTKDGHKVEHKKNFNIGIYTHLKVAMEKGFELPSRCLTADLFTSVIG